MLVTSHWSLVTVAEAAHLEPRDGLPVVFLEGAPYEIGRQHGELLKDAVRACVGRTLGYLREFLHVPLVDRLTANWWLDRSWAQSLTQIPPDYLEELRGLSEGSGVPLRELWRFHAIPDRTYACSGFAAWGRATTGGRLIHTRNLDWNVRIGVQRYATVFVLHPAGKQAIVSMGWAGLIGVLTGINEHGISIGQIGAETTDVSYRGMPMVFLMRRVLEQATSLDDGVRILRDAPRTVGVNYILADATARRGVAVETTRHHMAAFEADDAKEHAVNYARPIPEAVLRADTVMDPQIRERQLASGGDPRKPGLEPPTGSAYETRYLGQAAGILANYGSITPETARQIMRAIAPSSNIQSVVFAWPEAWVANADGSTRAAACRYRHLDLAELLNSPPQ